MDAGKLAWRRGGPGSPTANPAVPGRKRRSRGRPTPHCRVARHSLEPTRTPRWHLDQGPVRGRRPYSRALMASGAATSPVKVSSAGWALCDLPSWVPAPRGVGQRGTPVLLRTPAAGRAGRNGSGRRGAAAGTPSPRSEGPEHS